MQRCRRRRWMILGACAVDMVVVCLLGASLASGQAKPQPSKLGAANRPLQKPPMAEAVFKNVRVLRSIPISEFMDTMGFFAASLSLNCTSCHGVESASDVSKFADETPLKRTARKMVLMMNAINKTNFGGERVVTCYSCHRGNQRPEVRPSLDEQYGAPLPVDPDRVEIRKGIPAGLSADQIFDKYIQAVGGAGPLVSLTSFVAKGTYVGYDTDQEKAPVEVFAKTPDQRAVIVHILGGDKISTYDGGAAWIAEPQTPVPLMELVGGDLDGAKLDALLSFPARLKQIRSEWRVGAATIDDHEVGLVRGICG